MEVRFWEARVAPGRLDDATAWVRDWLQARSALIEGHAGSELFVADCVAAADAPDGAGDQPPRVVLLTRWTQRPAGLEDLEAVLPPDGSVERAHGWYFRSP